MNAGNRPEAAYDGEHEGDTYTVQIFPTETKAAPRGKRQVMLRVRYRRRTADFVEVVPRSFTEPFLHTLVRRLIDERWPAPPP